MEKLLACIVVQYKERKIYNSQIDELFSVILSKIVRADSLHEEIEWITLKNRMLCEIKNNSPSQSIKSDFYYYILEQLKK